jgi:hypothetical protein
MADLYEQIMETLNGRLEAGDGRAHELRQPEAVALQETEAPDHVLPSRPSQLGIIGADGEIEVEDTSMQQSDVPPVRMRGRIATDDGRAHMARQTVRGSGSFTLERLRQRRPASPRLFPIASESDADDQHDAGVAETGPTAESTERDTESERTVRTDPHGKPHITLYQVLYIQCTMF